MPYFLCIFCKRSKNVLILIYKFIRKSTRTIRLLLRIDLMTSKLKDTVQFTYFFFVIMSIKPNTTIWKKVMVIKVSVSCKKIKCIRFTWKVRTTSLTNFWASDGFLTKPIVSRQTVCFNVSSIWRFTSEFPLYTSK